MSPLRAARRLANVLKIVQQKVVFAESCTGGLTSAILSRVPGISAFHCGGVVTYRNETKTAYLGISAAMLADPGPVSEQVAEQMAVAVLERTAEASWSASVTGHLGPQAPATLDGKVFVGIAARMKSSTDGNVHVAVHQLQCPAGLDRYARQRWVAEQVLLLLAQQIGQ